MEKQLQDNLKLVAELMEWTLHPFGFFDYKDKRQFIGDVVTEWSLQIPVWAKLCSLFNDHGTFRATVVTRVEMNDYEIAVRNDNPRAGFDIIISIIKRIKK